MIKRIYFIILLGIVSLFLIACSDGTLNPGASTPSVEVSEVSQVSEPTPDSYPLPAQEIIGEYPLPEEEVVEPDDDAYPAPQFPIATDGVRFSLSEALQAGDTLVSGTAPPNLQLAIADVTLNGVVLGFGASDADGNFEISVSPLAESRRIGIMFAALEDGLTLTEMVEKYLPYRGEQFMNIPNTGVFMDTKLIE